jgi:large subunit ribosomal protein L3
MPLGLLGYKVGMTQVYDDQGQIAPVTVLQVGPCPVLQVRNQERDGYDAVQVGFGTVPTRKVNRPQAGQFEKHEVPPRRYLKELRDVSGEVGGTIGADVFDEGDKVHVTAVSKGKGFQGTVKRHGFGRGPVSHGSHNIRQPGSVGASADPSRIFPGQKMPGQMGNKGVTVKNLRVVTVDAENNELWVRGGVPGGKGSVVKIRKAGE